MDQLLSKHLKFAPDVLFQELDGEAVLLDLNSEQYFGLDDVGTRIWQLSEQNSSLASTYQRLLAEYDVDDSALYEDLRQFVDEIMSMGLARLEID